MKKYKGYVKTDRAGSTTEFEFEVEDDATEEQIQEIALECMWDCIEMNYEESPSVNSCRRVNAAKKDGIEPSNFFSSISSISASWA